jgi:hypothetical protein
MSDCRASYNSCRDEIRCGFFPALGLRLIRTSGL